MAQMKKLAACAVVLSFAAMPMMSMAAEGSAPEQAPAAVAAPAPQAQVAAPAPAAHATHTKAVKKAHTPSVSAVQKALVEHGAKIKVTGKMNKATHNALKAFQKENGLKETGKTDKETLKKLGLAKA